jgi:hypothetical protein
MFEALSSILNGPLIHHSRPDANLARIQIDPSGYVDLTGTEDS